MKVDTRIIIVIIPIIIIINIIIITNIIVMMSYQQLTVSTNIFLAEFCIATL